jgi:U3 small nucleolar RNA-associated protein 22
MQAFRIVDRGPPANAAKPSAAFRSLWGDRAEMRRFPDGTIHEAVVWHHLPEDQRPAIPELIVTCILERHFPGAKVSCWPLHRLSNARILRLSQGK